jgi:hypothetical protein
MTNFTSGLPQPLPTVVKPQELDPVTRASAIGAAIDLTSDWVREVVPALPTASLLAYVTFALRLVLMLGGSVGATWAEAVTGNQLQQVAFIVAALIGAGWSAYRKWQSDREKDQAAHASGAASAQATIETGVPTVVAVQPKPSVL